MMEVTAIIRMGMMNQTKAALSEAGIAAFFACECQGRGKGLVNEMVLAAAAAGSEEAASLLGEKGRLFPKRLLTVVVPDSSVDTVVRAIMAVNKTGKPGDGKIFVAPVLDSARVRTAETGEDAIL